MSLLSQQVAGYLDRASWIRKMFEAGSVLKAEFGEDKVYDFSLGNPDLPPPEAVKKALADLADSAGSPFAFGYMPNAGFPEARKALSEVVGKEQSVKLAADDILITCGAAGGLNALFRAIFEPGDEVICPSPFFVEYGFYVQNHGGILKPVATREETFELDVEAIESGIGPKTKVVLINSPNNPSGQVYDRESLENLAGVLKRKSIEFGHPIFLVSDEPYRFLVFDGVEVPPVLDVYPHSVVVSSFSKSLSLAGERVGYVAVSPDMPGKAELMEGLVLTNRILGFVNAPAIGQKIMLGALGAQVDVSIYESRRAAMAEVLKEAGYTFTMPKGSFYFFPEAPGGDDVEFVKKLQESRVLAVPGTGFGCPGYFRLTFCVDESVIRNSAKGFKHAIED